MYFWNIKACKDLFEVGAGTAHGETAHTAGNMAKYMQGCTK